MSTAQVGQKTKWVNDHYDGKHSDGLENGAKKFDYAGYTVDHYDDAKAKHKDAGGAAVATPAPAAKAKVETKDA